MPKKFDFKGWATKCNIKCSDGLIIGNDAFAHNDGAKVPLVWNHQHSSPSNILGYAILHNDSGSMLCDGYFNDTKQGNDAKKLLEHGDIGSLSIYANHLTKRGNVVVHGNICEVSLVLAGANPGAQIITTDMCHSDTGEPEEEAIISFYEPITIDEESSELTHSDASSAIAPNTSTASAEGKTIGEIFDGMDETKKKVAAYIIDQSLKALTENGRVEAVGNNMQHSDDNGITVGDVTKTFTDEEKFAIAYIIAQEAKRLGLNLDDKNSKSEGDNEMSHNAFDQNNAPETEGDVLSHSDMVAIFNDVEQYGTLKKSALAHGITNIDYLFPDYQNVTNEPVWLNERTEWVTAVMDGVKHSPMSRIRTRYADITPEAARAKGYMKGHYKYEEVFEILKRTTDPQTIYKKQSLDKDDINDIVDFDVVAWTKGEMRVKFDEEIARSILISDGRSNLSEDKIKESHVRSIYHDDEVYAIHYPITVTSSATDDQKAKAVVRAAVKSRKGYKGAGQPTFFTTEDALTNLLLLEDGIGHRLYKTEAELATALRVKNIYTVPCMEDVSRVVDGSTMYLVGIIVNLKDYTVGADKGGKTTLFEDFDIDYNKEKYLLECRISGALTVPKSAIVLEMNYNLSLTVEPEDATTILGKNVSDLQEDIVVNDKSIDGRLKYVTNYTGYSQDPTENYGNFLALQFAHTTGATTEVGFVGKTLKTLDSDMNCVFRVTDPKHQKIKCVTTSGGTSITRIFDLSLLECDTE